MLKRNEVILLVDVLEFQFTRELSFFRADCFSMLFGKNVLYLLIICILVLRTRITTNNFVSLSVYVLALISLRYVFLLYL